MNNNEYLAQLEVWEWKEILYNELKTSVPRNNWAEHLNNLAKSTIKFLEKRKKAKQQAIA
jgi:hypothetical protein